MIGANGTRRGKKMKICLINASQPQNGNNDSYVDFRNYSSFEDAKWRSWHSIPCALKTEFFAYNGKNFTDCYKYDGVIVVFNHNPENLIPFIKKLKMMGKTVAVGYHEGFKDFMDKSNANLNWLENTRKLVKESNFYLNVMPSKNHIYTEILEKKCIKTYHAAPFGFYDNLIVPIQKREGIIISTRTFNQTLSRNTLWSLFDANQYCKKNNTFFTFVCEDNLDEMHHSVLLRLDRMQLVKGPLSYNDWLKLIAKHKFMFGHDEAHSMAQMSLDAALVGVPAYGGNGQCNELALTSLVNLDIIHYSQHDRHHEDSVSALNDTCNFESVAKNILEGFLKNN